MNNYPQVSSQIIHTFENKFLSLPVRNQSHWSVRRYRMTGSEEYIQPVAMGFQYRTLKFLPILHRIQNKDFIREVSQKMIEHCDPSTPRKAKRLDTYKKYPKLLFLLNLIEYLFFAKSYCMEQDGSFLSFFEQGIKYLQDLELEKEYLNTDLCLSNPSALANTTYYLKYLGVCDNEDKVHELMRDVWSRKNVKEDKEYHLKIYGMTHLVIASSFYYQDYVSIPNKHEWVLNFFNQNGEEIISRTTLDILAEVGVSFKLCKNESVLVEQIKQKLVESFDKSLGMVPWGNKGADLGKAEHRNILTLLLLEEFNQFYPGPNLPEFFKRRKESLCLPLNLSNHDVLMEYQES